ncbi:class I adenylate-forming enzyme family protein [Advenella kashmirensis]
MHSLTNKQPTLYGIEEFAKYHHDGLWGTRLIIDYIDDHAKATPNKIAIVEQHRKLSYSELARTSRNIAASLALMGIGKGDVVAVQAPNWAELPIIHLATNRIGAIFVPLSEGFRETELHHLLSVSAAKVVFCPESVRNKNHLTFVENICSRLPNAKHVIPLRPSSSWTGNSFDSMSEREDWIDAHGHEWLANMRGEADDPSHVMVSSGSTGMPRCSLFSDNNTLVKLCYQYAQASGVSSKDVAAALAPAGTGSTGYNYPILTMLLHGGTSVLLEHWNSSRISEVYELIESNGCTMAVAVPAQLAKLVQFANEANIQHIRLRVISNSGAKLPETVAVAAERLFSCKVQTIYGSSEAGATAMTRITDPDNKRRLTVGRPLPGQQVRLVAEDGTEVNQGDSGEVCWRGPNKSYGFLNDNLSTSSVWDEDGWMHSGDLGIIDADGYLSIVGRKKDMIIRGGQNINPGVIEDVLMRHASFSEVAVVGFEDEILGERIAACVVCEESLQLDYVKSLVLSNGLAPWHQPELLVCLLELPRNAGGKIDKRKLREIAGAVAREQSQTGVILS